MTGDRWLGGSVQGLWASNGIFPIQIKWGAKELLRVSRSHESCIAWFDNKNLTFCFILVYYLIFQDTDILSLPVTEINKWPEMQNFRLNSANLYIVIHKQIQKYITIKILSGKLTKKLLKMAQSK